MDWFDKGVNTKDDLEAKYCYKKNLEMNPEHFSSWNNLANTLRQLEEYEDALNAIDKAIEIEPQNAIPYYNKGNKGLAFLALEQPLLALECLESALALDDSLDAVLATKGRSLYQLNRLGKALFAFQKAFDLNPKNDQAHRGIIATLASLKRVDELIAFHEINKSA